MMPGATVRCLHRRFAVSLNLNTGDYEGGCLRFPEFGPHLYVAPAGGAVVFSCSLLHEEATAVADSFDKVTYAAVRREHNELADRLVNEALDAENAR